jgi:NADH-quinone oxidoreductase subunit J
MISQILFAAFAAVLVVSSLLVILHRNPVTSALFLIAAFCSLAGIYLTLHAEFLGMVQVLVYAGAIMVLFLFVIMYLNLQHDLESGVQIAVRRGLGWIAGGVTLAEAVLFVSRQWAIGPTAPPEPIAAAGNTQAVGLALYTRYLFPFEITSMVLLVAMVGAIVISRPRRARTEPPRTVKMASVPAADPRNAQRTPPNEEPEPEEPATAASQALPVAGGVGPARPGEVRS